MGPDWAPYGLAHFKIILNQPKYDIIVLMITQLKGCLVMSLGIDKHRNILILSFGEWAQTGPHLG